MKISTVARLSFITVVVVYILYGIINKANDYLYQKQADIVRPVVTQKVEIPKESEHLDLDSIECMALNIYHESRNQSLAGRLAVGYVTLNRVNNDKYPDTICGVVKQAKMNRWYLEKHNKRVPSRNKCQFSWYCDGKADQPLESDAWEEAYLLAIHVINMYGTITDPTEGSIMYHAVNVKPYWTKAYKHTVTIGDHIFYGSY